MHVIKEMPTKLYNGSGNPVVQKLISHQGWYLLVSTAHCGISGIETMLFLCDKHGAWTHSTEILCTYGKSYEESEQRMFDALLPPTTQLWPNDVYTPTFSVEKWADRQLRHMYDCEYDGAEIAEFLRAIMASRGM